MSLRARKRLVHLEHGVPRRLDADGSFPIKDTGDAVSYMARDRTAHGTGLLADGPGRPRLPTTYLFVGVDGPVARRAGPGTSW